MFIGSEKPCWGEFNKLLYCIVLIGKQLFGKYKENFDVSREGT